MQQGYGEGGYLFFSVSSAFDGRIGKLPPFSKHVIFPPDFFIFVYPVAFICDSEKLLWGDYEASVEMLSDWWCESKFGSRMKFQQVNLALWEELAILRNFRYDEHSANIEWTRPTLWNIKTIEIINSNGHGLSLPTDPGSTYSRLHN